MGNPVARVHTSCLREEVVQKIVFNAWHKATNRRSAFAGLLLALFVATLSLTYFETLHHALHGDDANKAGHQCAVVLLKQGLLDAAESFVAATPHTAAPVEQVFHTDVLVATSAYYLPPGRAPPQFLA